MEQNTQRWTEPLALLKILILSNKILEKTCKSLEDIKERGHVAPELERIGIKTYREIHHKTYRIIYQVTKRDVYVHCVLDGRRDMMTLLEDRLLR